jgi:hypothetical protein
MLTIGPRSDRKGRRRAEPICPQSPSKNAGLAMVTAATSSLATWAQVATAVFAVLIAALVPLSAYLRRPKVTLGEDERGESSEIAGGVEPRVRLLARNARRRRAAHKTTVELVGYRRKTETEWKWLGNLPLHWTGTSTEVAVTVYSGATRPLELGSLFWKPPEGWLPPGYAASGPEALKAAMDEASVWTFQPALHPGGMIPLAPGARVLRLVVGAEDGDASTYDVDVSCRGDDPDPHAAFDSLQLALRDQEG